MSHAANLKLRQGHAHPPSKRQRQSLEGSKAPSKVNGIHIPFTNGDTGVQAHTTRDVKRRKRDHDDEKTPALVASTDVGLSTPMSQDVVEISRGDDGDIYQDSSDEEEDEDEDDEEEEEQIQDDEEAGDENSSEVAEEDERQRTSLKSSKRASKHSQNGQAHDRDATEQEQGDEEMSFGDLLVAKHGQDPISVDVVEAEKKKSGSSGALTAYQPQGSLTAPNAASLGTVLTQALRTNDVELLESCLHVPNLDSIRATIERLHSSLAASLLSKLAERMHKRPGRAGSLMVWVQWTVVAHGGYLASQPAAMQQLRTLYQVVKQRASGLQPLLALKGKLDMLEAQMQLRRRMQERSRELHGDNAEPYIYVEGEDSDDDAENDQAKSIGPDAEDSDVDDDDDQAEEADDITAPAALEDDDDEEDEDEDEDDDEDEDEDDDLLVDDEAEETDEDSLDENDDPDEYEDEGEELDDSISSGEGSEEEPQPKSTKPRK